MGSVPVIDVGSLRTGNTADLLSLSKELGTAAREIGFFSIVNHGMEMQVRDMLSQSERFFALPIDEKQRLSIAHTSNYRGYAGMFYEQLDEAHPADAKESYDVGRELSADHPAFAGAFRGPNPWPDLPGFRDALIGYFDSSERLLIDLHRPLAMDLGVEADYFTSRINFGLQTLRLLHYPPHPKLFDGSLHGAAPHTDYGILTLLAQDDAGGLELRMRDGTWLPVEPVAGAFVCNIGDCLMRWSNDTYVSTLHRVVNRAQRERYSIAFFGSPNADAVIETLPSCTVGRAALYAPTTYEEYLRFRITAAYPQKIVT